jgi:hypothetical protein
MLLTGWGKLRSHWNNQVKKRGRTEFALSELGAMLEIGVGGYADPQY